MKRVPTCDVCMENVSNFKRSADLRFECSKPIDGGPLGGIDKDRAIQADLCFECMEPVGKAIRGIIKELQEIHVEKEKANAR